MRVAVVLVGLLAGAAHAQGAEPPTTGQRVILVAAAVGGGLVVAPWIGPFAPLGIAAATYGTSAALGFDPSLRTVAYQTLVGTLVGAGTTIVVYLLLTEIGGADGDLSASLGSGAIGLVAAGALTGHLHAQGLAADAGAVEVGPAAFRAPTGERGLGLRLRVGL